jgi:MFS family permease
VSQNSVADDVCHAEYFRRLLAGRVGDLYGYRRLFVLGCFVFALTSLGAGLTYYNPRSPIPFDVLRGLQGLGPSLMLPNGLAILAREYHDRPPHEKGLAFSSFGSVAPGGFVVGAVFSSLTAQKGHWAWTFYAMAIACVVLGILSLLVIPADGPIQRTSFSETIRRLDILGATIGILGLLSFNFAWNQAPLVLWQNAQIITTLVIGLALLVFFLWYEKYMTDYPLLPWHTFSSKASFVLACIAGGWSSFGIWVYYYVQQGLVVENLTPLTMSARLSPAAISGLCAAFTTSLLIKKGLPASIIMTISMLAFFTGAILLATRPAHQIYWAQLFVATIVTPWGMDMSFPAATLILSAAMPHEHQGLAASLVTTFVNYSISIGLGIAGTVDTYTNRGATDVQRGIVNARWSGVALAAAAVCIGLVYCLFENIESRRDSKVDVEKTETASSNTV